MNNDEQEPAFGQQASWICFKQGGCEHGAPDAVDVAFLFLQTRRTKAEKIQELCDHAGIKKEDAQKIIREAKDAEAMLTCIQCPYLNVDEEGPFEEVFPLFMNIARTRASALSKRAYAGDDLCITAAWKGEARRFVYTNKGQLIG